MIRDLLTNRGRLAAIAASLLIVAAGPAGQLDTSLERAVIPVGGVTLLRVTINSESIQPVKVPSVPGLDISYSGMQKNIQIINWKQSATVTISFTVRADRAGTFTIPSFVFQTPTGRVSSRPVMLKAVTGGAQGQPGEPGAGGQAMLATRMTLSKKSAYAGEPVIMTYYLLASGVTASLEGFSKNPEASGFVIQELNAEQKDEPYAEGGVQYVKTRIAAYALIPAGAGALKAGGGTVALLADSDAHFTFFGRPLPFESRRFIDFGTDTVSVKPLPPGAPAMFRGDVGSFTLKAEFDTGDVKVFQEKRVAVTVAGTGNFISMSGPVIEKESPDLKVISEEGQGKYSITGDGLSGEKKFTLTVIPTKAGRVDAGSVMMTFFNPRTGTYETAKSAPLVFNAVGDDSAGRMNFDENRNEGPRFNPVIVGAVAVMVGAVIALFIFWERKRLAIIRESVKGADDGKTAAESEEPDTEKTLRDIESRYRADDRPAFLRLADLMMSHIGGKMASPDEGGEKRRLFLSVKDRVNFYRYGGGAVDRAAMEEILRDIRAMMK